MIDRLSDLGEIPSWARDDLDGIEAGELTSVKSKEEKDTSSPLDGDKDKTASLDKKYKDNFFEHVDMIKADISAIRQAAQRVKEINEEATFTTTTVQENELSQRLRALVDETNKRAKKTKTSLASLKEENSKQKKENTIDPSDIRIRENFCYTLTRNFIDATNAYRNAQKKYTEDIKKKVRRQVLIVKPEATDEEIDEVMQTEGGKEALLKERILSKDSIKTAYQNVAGKCQDVRTLESSVAQLHQMFLDVALLTEQQGELLDNIEVNIYKSADYVNKGNIEIIGAVENQKKIRRRKCWLILIVAIVMMIFILVGTRMVA